MQACCHIMSSTKLTENKQLELTEHVAVSTHAFRQNMFLSYVYTFIQDKLLSSFDRTQCCLHTHIETGHIATIQQIIFACKMLSQRTHTFRQNMLLYWCTHLEHIAISMHTFRQNTLLYQCTHLDTTHCSIDAHI